MTVFLPNPYLSRERKIVKNPDWSRLDLWNYLRKEYLDLDSDQKKEGKMFYHG